MFKQSGIWSGSSNKISGINERGENTNVFNIAYTTQGTEGPVVILIHGFLLNRQEFFALQSLLSPFCRTVAIDLLGMGDSSKLLSGGTDLYTWKNDVDYIKAMAEDLYPDERYLIVGDHWGSCVGFTYASLYPDDLFGVVNINSILDSTSMSLTERQIARWGKTGNLVFDTIMEGFETTISSVFRSFTSKPCLWSEECYQIFLFPYYNWKLEGGNEVTYTTTSNIPVNVNTTIDSNSIGSGGIDRAFRDATRNVSEDITADISDDGVVNSSNAVDTAYVDRTVQNEINSGLSNTPRGNVRSESVATTTTLNPLAGTQIDVMGSRANVSVPANVNVTKQIRLNDGEQRMRAEIDQHAVRVLSERTRSAYRERTRQLSLRNREGIDYSRVGVPQAFITSCRYSLATQGIGWKMMNKLRVPVRVTEIDNEGQFVVIENPKKIANIIMEFIINLVGVRVLPNQFNGYEQKPATSICAWSKEVNSMYSYTATV